MYQVQIPIKAVSVHFTLRPFLAPYLRKLKDRLGSVTFEGLPALLMENQNQKPPIHFGLDTQT